MPPKKREPVSMLAEFSDMLQRIGEANERKNLARLAALTKDLPGQIRTVKAMNDEDLVTYLIESRRSFSDPRETVLWEKVHKAARKEVMRRLTLTVPAND